MTKLGMDTGAARATRDGMQSQIAALTEIASSLGATHRAASSPQSYGIGSGDRTVAPWSLHSVAAARTNLLDASSAAQALIQRIGTEAGAQDEASSDDHFFGDTNSVKSWYKDISDARSWLTRPRTLLELPAAVRMLAKHPDAWRTGMNVANWGSAGTLEQSTKLRTFTRSLKTPRWIRTMYQGASNLKFQNYVDPAYLHSSGLHSSPVGRWTDVFHVANPKVLSGIKMAATGIGKGFGVLGVGMGVYNIVDGVKSGDGWQVADGIVGTITSIGSFAPPPVGLVFAGVGLAYTAGRWLFGADSSGKTGIDHIADFANGAGKFVDEAAQNYVKGVTTVAAGAVHVATAAVDTAKKVIEKLWPW